MKNHSNLVKQVWFAIRNQAANDLFSRIIALIDDSTIVGKYNRLSTVDKTAVDQMFTNSKLFITEHNNQLLIGRTL